MKLARVGLLSLACVGGALGFGLVANAAIDLLMPMPPKAAMVDVSAPKSEETPAPASYALASTTATPVDFAPTKVKTIPMVYREERTEPVVQERSAAVPLPRPRPASAPAMEVSSIAHQPGTLAIAAATRKPQPDDGEVLGAAGIARMKLALALTAEQEEYWPAIATELQALGKTMKSSQKINHGKINVDNEAIQRLYWAAAPLITRLSYEQKAKVKQMARLMGLNQVAEAL